MASLRVCHLSTSAYEGGAAIATARLHQALITQGLASRLLAQRTGYAPSLRATEQFRPPRSLGARAERVGRRFLFALERSIAGAERQSSGRFVTNPRSRYGSQLDESCRDYDILNLHWGTGFVDLPWFVADTRQPKVMTLHDMNAFTGGCHYSMGCEAFQQRCGRCPYLDGRRNTDLSSRYWAVKQAAYNKVPDEDMVFVTPSDWLAQQASKSSLLQGRDIRVIRNGIDPQLFNPRDQARSREALAIPAERIVILFVSDGYALPWKGTREWVSAINALCDVDWLMPMSIGKQPLAAVEHPHYQHLGSIASEELLSGIYSVADAVVVPSQQDNFPNLILEAMASARLVITTAAGGIPELVNHKQTGLVVDFTDSREIFHILERLRDADDKLWSLGRAAREKVLKELTLDHQATAYARLYEELLRKPLLQREGV